MSNVQADQLLQSYIQRQELSELMLPMIGRLYRNNGIMMRVYGRPIINVSTVDILKTHRLRASIHGRGFVHPG